MLKKIAKECICNEYDGMGLSACGFYCHVHEHPLRDIENKLYQAVGKAYTYSKNAKKEMDADLAEAIVAETAFVVDKTVRETEVRVSANWHKIVAKHKEKKTFKPKVERKVAKYKTGDEIPDGAVYLWSKAEKTTTSHGSGYTGGQGGSGGGGFSSARLVWHYFLVEA